VHGNFSRSFYLPQTVKQDGSKATYREGILEIHVRKSRKRSLANLHRRELIALATFPQCVAQFGMNENLAITSQEFLFHQFLH